MDGTHRAQAARLRGDPGIWVYVGATLNRNWTQDMDSEECTEEAAALPLPSPTSLRRLSP